MCGSRQNDCCFTFRIKLKGRGALLDYDTVFIHRDVIKIVSVHRLVWIRLSRWRPCRIRNSDAFTKPKHRHHCGLRHAPVERRQVAKPQVLEAPRLLPFRTPSPGSREYNRIGVPCANETTAGDATIMTTMQRTEKCRGRICTLRFTSEETQERNASKAVYVASARHDEFSADLVRSAPQA